MSNVQLLDGLDSMIANAIETKKGMKDPISLTQENTLLQVLLETQDHLICTAVILCQ